MNGKRKTGPSIHRVPEGDNRPRLVCPDCGYIAYENPKLVVGAVCLAGDRVLLCRRAIEPRRGFWTVPAGFQELDETLAEGAAREVWEEACARIETENFIGLYEVPRIGQVHAFFRARLLSPEIAAGPESAAVAMVPWADIPWAEMAFPSVVWALERARAGGPPVIGLASDDSWPVGTRAARP